MEPNTTAPGGSLLERVVGRGQQPTTLAVFATLLVIFLATRFLSGYKTTQTGGWSAPSSPAYWIPYFGHAPHMFFDAGGFLARMRQRYSDGVFSLRLMGGVHSFVYRPSLVDALLNEPCSSVDDKWVSRRLMVSNFGMRPRDLAQFDEMAKELHKLCRRTLTGQGLEDMVKTTVKRLKQHVVDLVTFNSYPSDQMEWEQEASAEVVENSNAGRVMEVDLVQLTKYFVAKTSNPALFGTDLVENFPEMWKEVWTIDNSFLLLAMKLPMWVPWARLQRARAARRRLISYLQEFHQAMQKWLEGEDPGARWQDLDNASQLVQERAKLFRNHGVPMAARAAHDTALAWYMNASSGPLVFWMLFELNRDCVLLEQVREEVEPYIKVVQPENEFSLAVWVPPDVQKLDVEGLMNDCPLLKSAYIETLRVYTASWAVKWMQQDVALNNGVDGERKTLFKKGTYVHIPQELQHLDPACFPDPNEWQADRHIKEKVDEKGRTTRTAEMGSIQPSGDGTTMYKSQDLAMREILSYVSVIISMYDIQPADGGKWKMPRLVRQAEMKHPANPVKVWVKRRQTGDE